jgi:hypothetical protein
VQRAYDFGEHGHHAKQQLTRGFSLFRVDDLETATDLEDGRALGRGATSNPVDAGFLGLGVLAGAFGDVGSLRSPTLREPLASRASTLELRTMEMEARRS